MPRKYVKKGTRTGQVDEDSMTLPAGGLITPEVIRPYPIVDRTESKKSRKGKQQGKSRIYTDTPAKIRLEEIEKAKQLKKQEQEIKQKAKEMKRAFNLVSANTNPKRQKKTVRTTKSKRQKKSFKPVSEDESDSEEKVLVLPSKKRPSNWMFKMKLQLCL